MKSFQKYISIHSEDRDLTKYPNAAKFAFELPVEYKNVCSLRLSDIYLPPLYTFSESRNNLSFSIQRITEVKTITISPGNYTIDTLLTELKTAINKAYPTNSIEVLVDPIRNTIVFGSDVILTLLFFNRPIASYLGFQQINSNKSITITEYNEYSNHVTFITPPVYVLEAPYPYNLQGDPFIYMELDLFNSMDELTPYTPHKSTAKHNLAFAKIPRLTYVSKELYLSNAFYSDPPLERIQKFQCKFRYHDGTLVDFGVSKFSFTIEILMLR